MFMISRKAVPMSCFFVIVLPCFAQNAIASAPAPAASTATAPAPYTPITQRERTHRYLRSLISPESILRAAAGSGILQATNTPSEWGQGAEAYGIRFANSYGQHFIRQTLLYGASTALNEDNRYIPSERKGVGSRTLYAIESTFMARRPDGTRHLSYSRIGAVVATAFISRAWQPPSTNGAQNAFYSMGDVFASEAGFNVLHEFAPKLFHP